MPASNITFHFAWVAPDQTTYDPAFARFDENIFSLEIEHLEGQIPTAKVEVINPGQGLLNPDRAKWAWISFDNDGCGPAPLFFGRLVGIPTELQNDTIMMNFITRRQDFIPMKQRVAETLKTLPNYDPIFFQAAKRDDPDTILEGWSRLYHIDRVDGFVTTSDVLMGEDGTVIFDPTDTFYDSVQVKILQPPLTAVNVKAEVIWQQEYRDYFYVGSWAWPTLGSDPFVSDWPKSGSNLGGGWSAGISWAGERDPPIETEFALTTQPQPYSYHYSWQNLAKQHHIGDTMSVEMNATISGLPNHVKIKEVSQFGFIDPYAKDENGDPSPINIPAVASVDYFDYKTFALGFEGKQSLATLGLTYHANRKRSERLDMTVRANTQDVLYEPLVTETTEQITMNSGDLSLPLINLLNWSSIQGTDVGPGQLIFPDNPRIPGQTSTQICTGAGTAGDLEPDFSNVAGQTTSDGTVTWTSMGDTQPSENAQDWVRLAPVPLGALLLPKPISGAPDRASLLTAGSLNYPPTGVGLAVYTVLTDGNGGPGANMWEVTTAGIYGGLSPAQAVMQSFVNPTGRTLFICVQAGTTGEFHPTFDETPGNITSDGNQTPPVHWMSLGPIDLPIGGSAGQTPASSYFTTDRGNLSLEHGLCRARAKLRRRARAVQVDFDTRFEVAAMLSCRMNGLVYDRRLPGGNALGKVIGYKLTANGDTGALTGHVSLGVAVGNIPIGVNRPSEREAEPRTPTTLSLTDPGTPSYVDPGYVDPGYQTYLANPTYTAPPSNPPEIPPDWTAPPPWAQEPTYLPVQGVPFDPPTTPPGWPTLPSTLPHPGCSTGASVHTLGPDPIQGDELGYGPPNEITVDDGLRFPASPRDLILKQAWHGLASTLNPGNVALYNTQLVSVIMQAVQSANNTTQTTLTIPGGSTVTQGMTFPVPPILTIENTIKQRIFQDLLQGTALWYELVLKPVTNGPFGGAYVINTLSLALPSGIDLSANIPG